LSKLLENRRKEIESSDLIVYLIDECHLLWGDINGYIWGGNGGFKQKLLTIAEVRLINKAAIPELHKE